MWLIMSAMPGAMVAFFFTVEMPMGLKFHLYKMPTWLLSTIINIAIVTPLAGFMIGPLAVFVGEFIVWPALHWDSKKVNRIVGTILANGDKVGLFESKETIMEKYYKYNPKSKLNIRVAWPKMLTKK